MKTVTLKVDGMHCEGCAGRIRTLLQSEPGVRQAEVSFADGEARVRHNPHAVDVERLADVIEKGDSVWPSNPDRADGRGRPGLKPRSSGRRHLPRLASIAAVSLALVGTSAGAHGAERFHYNPGNVGSAAHWAARATLANAVMLSGLGEPLELSMSELDAILERAGYVMRPPMPEMALVGAVYAAGSPELRKGADFAEPSTLAWNAASFERTLDPAAQAWTMAKIASPEFHLQYHARKADRLAALLMLPQARAQAKALEDRLRSPAGVFAARTPDGSFREPRPRDQAPVLWGVSNLILAATSERDDYWHRAYRDLIDPDRYHGLAEAAFAAIAELPPASPVGRAIALEALGRYALVADGGQREAALRQAQAQANALRENPGRTLEDVALAVYGLTEAGRLLGDKAYAEAAAEVFRQRLRPLWNPELGAFETPQADGIVYTAERTGAVAAALDAMRWHGPDKLAARAAKLYPRFLEAVLVEAGLLLSSPRALVPEAYLGEEAAAAFAHPALPDPVKAGLAPVFAAEVRREDGAWIISDHRFRTAGAMFLTNMLVKRNDGRADPFLPEDRLAGLR